MQTDAVKLGCECRKCGIHKNPYCKGASDNRLSKQDIEEMPSFILWNYGYEQQRLKEDFEN